MASAHRRAFERGLGGRIRRRLGGTTTDAEPVAGDPGVRELPPDASGFSVVVFPDTQGETGVSGRPPYLQDMIDWVLTHRATYGIALVLHVGDLVDNADDDEQWRVASAAMRRLGEAGLPYLVSPGNHDNVVYRAGEPARYIGSARYDEYLPMSLFQAMPGYGGAMAADGSNVPGQATGAVSGQDCYLQLEVGGVTLLALSLPFAPSQRELRWAAELARAHPDAQVLITTHDYVGDDDQLRGNRPNILGYGLDSPLMRNADGSCRWYASGAGCVLEQALITNPGATVITEPDGLPPTDGLDLFTTVVEPHSNVRFVFSGHVIQAEHLLDGKPVKGRGPTDPTNGALAGTHRTVRADGSRSYGLMFNAQGVDGNGDRRGDGGGYLRLLRFRPTTDEVAVDTVSASGLPPLQDPANMFLLGEVGLRPSS